MAILTTTTNGLNFIGGTTYIQTGTTTLMSIAVDGSIAFNEYGAGYLKTDASGNITADNTGGGLPGGPYVTIGTNQTITGIKSFSSKIGADGGIDGLTLANGGITGSNYDITGVNQLVISDPGEGIVFTGTATMYLNAVDDATDSILKLTNATQLNLNSTARITSLVNPTGAQDAATKNYVDLEIATRTPLNDIRSLGVRAFTNGANPNITTAQVMDEIDTDGGFDSYSSVFKTSWDYAGNYNLTDAGDFTETAGSSWITWTDNSSDSARGNITTLAIAPNTGGSAGGVFIYNNQGGSYNPGWRQVWTSMTDGAGSGLDADLLDGQQGSYYLDYANFTGTPTIPSVGNGTLTMNTATGLDGGATFTANQSGNSTFAVSLDLSELADMTQAMIGSDEFIVLDNGAERRKAASEIGLSIFNNDAGFTSNTGNITAVTAGTFLTGGGNSGNVTLNADASKLAHIVDSSNGSVTSGWITVAQASGSRKAGEIYVTDGESGDHSYIRIEWMRSYQDSNFTVLNCGGHANRIQGVRVLEDTGDKTYGKKYIQIKVIATSNYYVIVTAPGTIPNYGDFIAETPVLENSKTGYNVKGNALIDLQNSSLGSEQGITSGGNIELNDDRFVFTRGDVLSLSAGGAGTGTEIVIDDGASVIKLDSDTIAQGEFKVSSLTDGTGDDVFRALVTSSAASFSLGDIEGLGDGAYIVSDGSTIKLRNNGGINTLVTNNNNDVEIPNGNLIIPEQIGVNTTNFNPQAGIIVNGNQTFGTPGGGANVNSRYLSIEGGADSAGEGSGRIFFSEHNSTTAAMDNYGMSLGYRGGPTSIVGASGETWSGLSQIGNGEWGMWGHNNSANGALIMHGDRAATYVDFSGNNIQGITDAYIADQIIHTGDTNTYMQFHAADQWRVVTGGSERLEVNNTYTKVNSGNFVVNNNVGVGTVSPTSPIGSTRYINVKSTGNGEIILDHTDAGTASDLGLYSWARNADHLAHIKASCDGSTTAAFISFHTQTTGGSFSNPASNERMRISSNGNVGIGTTSPRDKLDVVGTAYINNLRVGFTGSPSPPTSFFGTRGTFYNNAFQTNYMMHCVSSATNLGFTRGSSNSNALTFNAGDRTGATNSIGSITMNASSVSYNTTSDYRLKENEEKISNAIDRLKNLKPIRFNWISEPEGEKVDGFLAHEVAEVVPEAVTGEKDAIDYKGDDDLQMLENSKLVPLLTAALQQAIDKIEALEQRIQLIENK